MPYLILIVSLLLLWLFYYIMTSPTHYPHEVRQAALVIKNAIEHTEVEVDEDFSPICDSIILNQLTGKAAMKKIKEMASNLLELEVLSPTDLVLAGIKL